LVRTFLNIVLTISLLHGASSCKKFDEKTQFDISIEDAFTIPSIVGISVPFVNFPTPPVNTNIDQELKIQDRRKEKIESINLKELQLTITAPATNTFSFVNDVDVYLGAEGLPDIYIAHLHDIPSNVGKTLNLITDGSQELEAYIKKDVIDIKVDITTDETILQDVDVEVDATFFVDVKVFGI